MFKIPHPRLSNIRGKQPWCSYLLCGFILSFLFSGSSCIYQTNRPDFTWPVEKPYTLSRKFSMYHEGIDFPKQSGQPVLSTAKGKVIYTGTQFFGYGKTIIIEHEYNWASLYAHLSKIFVKTGNTVNKKQKIGEVGSTGRSTSAHLHFELMQEKQPLNPLPYLPEPD